MQSGTTTHSHRDFVMNEHSQFHARLEAHDDITINPSANPPLAELLNPSRRNVLKGGLTLAALGFFAGGISACGKASASPLFTPPATSPLLPAMNSASDADTLRDPPPRARTIGIVHMKY